MKDVLKFLPLLVSVCFISSACSDDDPLPGKEEEKHTVFEYEYTGERNYKDFTVYTGPEGKKIDADDKMANKFWGENSLFGKPGYKTLIIDTAKDSIYMKDEWSTIRVNIKIVGDTVKNDYNKVEYFGIMTDKETFVMNQAFYYIHYDGREEGHGEYPQIGHYGYWKYYEKARENEFFHGNSPFGSFSDMTLISDTIAYATDYYTYKLKKSY